MQSPAETMVVTRLAREDLRRAGSVWRVRAEKAVGKSCVESEAWKRRERRSERWSSRLEGLDGALLLLQCWRARWAKEAMWLWARCGERRLIM